MHFNALLLAATAVISASATPFGLLSVRSATQFQYAQINATNLLLEIGTQTTADPAPPQVSVTYPGTTSFILGYGGALYMNAGSTGIQYVYISPQTGLARITPAHTDYIPDGGIDNFVITGSPGFLSSPGLQSYACGTGPYTLEFNVPALNTANCVEIDLLVDYFMSDNATAWSYE